MKPDPHKHLLISHNSCPGFQLVPQIFLITEYKEQTAGSFSSKESIGTSVQSLTLYNMPVFLVNRICRLCIKGTAQPIKATYAQLSKKEHLAVTAVRCLAKSIQLHLYKPQFKRHRIVTHMLARVEGILAACFRADTEIAGRD